MIDKSKLNMEFGIEGNGCEKWIDYDEAVNFETYNFTGIYVVIAQNNDVFLCKSPEEYYKKLPIRLMNKQKRELYKGEIIVLTENEVRYRFQDKSIVEIFNGKVSYYRNLKEFEDYNEDGYYTGFECDRNVSAEILLTILIASRYDGKAMSPKEALKEFLDRREVFIKYGYSVPVLGEYDNDYFEEWWK